MKPEQPAIVTVPTELGRADGFIDMAVLLGAGGMVWWLALKGIPVWAFIPALLVLAIWVLTGEPAGDIRFVGAIASGLRAKLGMRRASEWLAAWLHYFSVRIWPDKVTQWQNSRLRSKIRTLTSSPRLRTLSTALHINRPQRLCMPSWLSTARARMRPTSR